ncbi:MAG: hypothetical protein KGQ95_07960 [Acidobacteria bacterium]|nr:hypothetical protein [Acidobacteriota bacterium]
MKVPLPTLEVLERTRRGEPVDPADVAALVNAWTTGAASDAQMAAWCATAGLRGVPYEASLAVVRALLAGGDRLELGRLGPTVDIRSAGGVGDSSLVIAASCLAAAGGVIVASTGAHAIAHVGGVLDAVEAIPGMRSEMGVEQWVLQARDAAMVIAEPGERLVPEERRLASLRDGTATAEGDAMVAIAAAARGISGGAGVLALEIPGGSGALLPDMEHARAACDLATRLGGEWNREVVAVPSERAQPMGGVAGHVLEVREAFAVLRGDGDAGLADSACALAAAALGAAGVDGDAEAVRQLIRDGRGVAAAERWVAAQGGDPAVVGHADLLPRAAIRSTVPAARAGTVTAADGGRIGAAARWLGAGRLDPGQVIDPLAGVEVVARPGAAVAEGDVLAIVHGSDQWLVDRGVEMVAGAIAVGD